MDKNFINVDDLVRQRLEGREEREPSGAWLNMRELLDEKMPQRKVVPFFWNRMFGAVGIAALLGLISVGGYELSAYKELGHTAPVASAATVVAPTGTAHNEATPADVATDRRLNATGVTDDAAKPADATGVAAHKAAHKKTATDNTNNTITKPAKNNSQTATENTATTGTAPSKATEKAANNHTATAPHSKKNTAKSTETATTAVLKHNTAKSDKQSQPATTTVAGTTAASNLTVSNNSKDAKAANHNDAIAHHKAGNRKTGAASQPVVATTTADNSSTAAKANDKDAVAKTDNNTTDVHNMPLSSSSTPANNASESVPGKVSGNNMVASKASIPVANSTAPGNTTGKPANTTTGTTGNGTPKTATVGKLPNNTTANNSKGKRVWTKLVVFQRAIKNVNTEQSESKYRIDTVSMETLIEELGMANPAMSSAPDAAAKKSNLGNMINTTTDADGATILPGSASSATNAPGSAAKTNAATKNSGSVSPVEKLKEEFNDVKTKVSLIRFAPGLTAGINGTFFGPNSFKGFQFGLSGELFFNDDLGLMAEFKYFHRINNDYQVNDNYYNYLNNGTKQLMLNSYSFSALHSLELPISIRYSKGNFTFIAGGNIVYSFSINTGAATIASPTAPVATNVSPAQATDNKPQLNASDFNSRFGLGYLFGVAYKVSPNVTLDLRDVQSFWDNAGSSGAKSVSTQLYKSPSFQFSLNYRLGKKNRGE